MKKLILYTPIILFLVTSCASFHPKGFIDPAFQEYVNQYTLDKYTYTQRGLDDTISMFFGPHVMVDDTTIKNGHCSNTSFVLDSYIKRVVIINETQWYRYSETQRLKLIYHELAHCDLSMRHNDYEISLLNTYTNSLINKDNFSYYVERLFISWIN